MIRVMGTIRISHALILIFLGSTGFYVEKDLQVLQGLAQLDSQLAHNFELALLPDVLHF